MNKKLLRIAGASALLLAGIGSATADTKTRPQAAPAKHVSPTRQEDDGSGSEGTFTPARVSVCTNIEAKTCKSADLPVETGRVTQVIRGAWASPVTASGTWLALTNKHASLCYMGSKSTNVECFPVPAYVPDADIAYNDMGSGLKGMTFTRHANATGTLEDYSLSVKIFVRAVDSTAAQLQERARNTYHTAVQVQANVRAAAKDGGKNQQKNGAYSSPTLIDNSGGCGGDCSTGSDGTYEQGSEATWDDTSNDWDYTTDSSQPASDTTGADPKDDKWDYPRVVIGPPDKEPEAGDAPPPPLDYIWPDEVVIAPDVPPSTEEPEMVKASDIKCVMSGFIMVCTAKRPQPEPIDPADVPLTPPRPWNPTIPKWSFCGTFHVFCSTPDNDRGDNSSHDGKTYEELAAVCADNNNTDHQVCEASRSYGADYRTIRACKERADARYAACLSTARATSRN